MKPTISSCGGVAACGPLLSFDFRSCVRRSARRGRRHPARAHAVAVDAAHRLRSGARFGVAFPNSLRSLCSLRSNSGNESVYEARCARRPRISAPHRHRNRPRRVPPAANAKCGGGAQKERHGGSAKARPGRVQRFVWSVEEVSTDTNGPVDRLCLANGRASRPGAACKARAFGRARSALRQLTRFHCLSAVSEANAASSETGRANEHRRAVVAQRRPRSPRRCARPGRDFAAATCTYQTIRMTTTGRQPTFSRLVLPLYSAKLTPSAA